MASVLTTLFVDVPPTARYSPLNRIVAFLNPARSGTASSMEKEGISMKHYLFILLAIMVGVLFFVSTAY